MLLFIFKTIYNLVMLFFALKSYAGYNMLNIILNKIIIISQYFYNLPYLINKNIEKIAAFFACISFIIYIVKFIVYQYNIRHPIRAVYFNENTNTPDEMTKENKFLEYGQEMTFKINFSTKFEKAIIEDFYMEVCHGLSPKQYLRYFDSNETIYIFANYCETNMTVQNENFVKTSVLNYNRKFYSNFDVLYGKVYFKKMRKSKIGFLNNLHYIRMKRNKMIEHNLQFNRIPYELNFPVFYAKFNIKGIISEYCIYTTFITGPRS